ncbi:hypothetical protein HNR46_002432 [Haloferula luteola]|uniref:Uncharacterized protein n=1 Tax=Haloferula luteola TaxID=595692 RepID=A0A840VED3_9BACT|nr:hypothetical protein [Haloferula luteola]MBB5352189.1 hypothetical protein [Haloferula luteola]
MKAALILFGWVMVCGLTAARPTPETPSSPVSATALGDGSVKKESESPGDSVILHDGTNWTMVPQGAFLFFPEALQTHIVDRPLGRLMSWKDFLRRNRDWIRAERITLQQADGSAPLDPRRLDYFTRQTRAIVAVAPETPVIVALQAPLDGTETAQLR